MPVAMWLVGKAHTPPCLLTTSLAAVEMFPFAFKYFYNFFFTALKTNLEVSPLIQIVNFYSKLFLFYEFLQRQQKQVIPARIKI